MSKIIDFILSAGIILGSYALGGQDGATFAVLCLILSEVICIRWEMHE